MTDKTKNYLWVLFIIICFAIFGYLMITLMVTNKVNSPDGGMPTAADENTTAFQAPTQVHFTNAKIATAVDENMLPVKVTNIFPAGTTQVFCWFQWQDSDVNTQIVAKWEYVTDRIHILDYAFSIPRRKGMGSISLSMPEGKTLPSGEYRINLTKEDQTLKSLLFKIK